jgi:DNA (cytosine-5)-methyltransferase 1
MAARVRPPSLRVFGDFTGELVIDNFAGGGGASTGIEAAIGRPCDIAINHNADAIRMHQANHPETRHYVEDIWQVDPREACSGLPVGLVWFSPDCTHFSRARGYKPVIRGLAWTVVRWAKAVAPRVMVMENVEEFQTWGPLIEVERNGETVQMPDPDRKGETFERWVAKLRDLGYAIEFRSLNAADYGAPTTRRRLFMIARRDRMQDQVVFPEATHGKGRDLPWVPAHEVIDWTLNCPSIFTRKRKLADATMNRIAMGVERYVSNGDPFIVRHGHYSKRTGAGLLPGKGAGLFRGQSLDDPLATICATNDKNLVVPWLIKHYGGMVGNPMTDTIGTVTARDSQSLAAALLAPEGATDRSAQVNAFLLKYYGTAVGQSMKQPLHTITTKDRFALIEVLGTPYRIIDIGMRMLQPGELYSAQGFPTGYQHEVDGEGVAFTKTQQIALCGNSVAPPVAEAIVAEQMAA